MNRRFLVLLMALILLTTAFATSCQAIKDRFSNPTLDLTNQGQDVTPDDDSEDDDDESGSAPAPTPITPATTPDIDALGLVYTDCGGYYAVTGYRVEAGKENELITLTIPSTHKDLPVKTIGYRAFAPDAVSDNTNLANVIIPEGVTRIEASAFAGCANLTSVTIPNTVTYMGMHAFDRCTSLTYINIPASVTDIRVPAFSGCIRLASINVASDNPKYTTIDGCLYSKDGKVLYRYPIGRISEVKTESGTQYTTYTIPDAVTTITESAFQGADFTQIIIPANVCRIERGAFKDCLKLERARFAVTSGWWRTQSPEYETQGTVANVTNSYTMAEWLTKTSLGNNNFWLMRTVS